MKALQAMGEQMEAARRLEKDDRLSDAAAIYQKLFNSNPMAEPVINRLLVVYRKLKDYQKELSVLNDAIAAYQQRQKAAQKTWIEQHPEAAGAGRSMLRQLEKAGYTPTGLGGNSMFERLVKRKDLVTNRITGKKGRVPAKGKISAKSAKSKKIIPKVQAKIVHLRPKELTEKRRRQEEAAALRKKAAQERKEAAARKKREQREKRVAEASRRKEEQAQKKAEGAQQRAEAVRKKEEAQQHPSLFLVILRYLVDLEEIDAMMKQHIAYLKKHYDSGDFLVSGRQVPRTGGVILARAKDRKAMERKIKEDPFVKRKLASADIIEFTVNQFGKGLFPLPPVQ